MSLKKGYINASIMDTPAVKNVKIIRYGKIKTIVHDNFIPVNRNIIKYIIYSKNVMIRFEKTIENGRRSRGIFTFSIISLFL